MDEIEVQYLSALEIAQALIDGEATLTQLKSVAAFAPKANNTEDAVWEICKRNSNIKRYGEIYLNGKHKTEIEQILWDQAESKGLLDGYLSYLNLYPNGMYLSEVDDRVWDLTRKNGTIHLYKKYFPGGRHIAEADGISAANACDEDDWREASVIHSVPAYQDYIGKHPNGLHVDEARRRINEIQSKEKERIISELIEDPNAYRRGYLRTAFGINRDDLRGRIKDSHGNVRDELFRSWDKKAKNFRMESSADSIPKGCTEVYFWGIPGSGKTCAMASILSRARQMGCFAPRTGAGLAYMNDLSIAFLQEPGYPAICLPPATDIESTQYLPLTLNEEIKDRRGNKVIKRHDISIIEVSGEIFKCFSNELEGRPQETEAHERTYTKLKEFLESRENPKFHFFILDSKPMRDADQMLYLQNAALYFEHNKVFNETTQDISLIVTKCDSLSPDKSRWKECAVKSANTNFKSLVTQLQSILGDPRSGGLGISDGSIKVIPLSIGEVFFQDLCFFDPEPAEKLVNRLIEYSKVAETDDWRTRGRRLFHR